MNHSRNPFDDPDFHMFPEGANRDDFQISLSDSDLAALEPDTPIMPNARPGKGRLLALVAQRDKFQADADAAYERWCALTKESQGPQAFTRPQGLAMQIKSADTALATAEAGFRNASRLVRIAEQLWGPIESYVAIPDTGNSPEPPARGPDADRERDRL